MDPHDRRTPEALSGSRLAGAIALGLVGAAVGLGPWLGVTARTGQYRAFLAAGVALGVALGVRILSGQGGRRAQAVGLAISLPAIALGQYLAICLCWRAAELTRGPATGSLLIDLGRFLEGWRKLRDPGREAIFLAVSLALVLWLLRRRRPPRA